MVRLALGISALGGGGLGGEVAEAFTEAGVFAGLGALAVDSVLTLL